MELLKTKLKELYEIDNNWIQTVKEEQNENVSSHNEELVRLYNDFWRAMREALKKDYRSAVAFFEECVGEDGNWLLEDIRKSLIAFFSLSFLREMQKDNPEKGKNVIKYLFENVVLYFDPQFANVYLEFGFESLDMFIDTARTIDGLIGYYISHHYTMEAIKKDLKDETEFSDHVCDYVVGLIKENYQTLQLNVIMDSLHME